MSLGRIRSDMNCDGLPGARVLDGTKIAALVEGEIYAKSACLIRDSIWRGWIGTTQKARALENTIQPCKGEWDGAFFLSTSRAIDGFVFL